jgi:GAF domain-containing protein
MLTLTLPGRDVLFEAGDLETLQLLGAMSAIAIGQHFLLAEHLDVHANAAASRELMALAVEGLSLTPATAAAVGLAFSSQVNAETAVVFRTDLLSDDVNEAGETILQERVIRVEPSGEKELVAERHLHCGVVLAVIRTKQCVVLGTEATTDERFNTEVDLPRGAGGDLPAPPLLHVTALICCPLLRSDGQVLGAVTVLNKRGAGYGSGRLQFSQEDVGKVGDPHPPNPNLNPDPNWMARPCPLPASPRALGRSSQSPRAGTPPASAAVLRSRPPVER